MASATSLAAIALTLIIAAPICLGYALATEDESYNAWVSDGSVNLSNQILNSSTNFYNDYTGPNNNSSIIQYREVGGSVETVLTSPSYLVTGDTPTSIPVYNNSEAGSLLSLDPASSNTVTLSDTTLDGSSYYTDTSYGYGGTVSYWFGFGSPSAYDHVINPTSGYYYFTMNGNYTVSVINSFMVETVRWSGGAHDTFEALVDGTTIYYANYDKTAYYTGSFIITTSGMDNLAGFTLSSSPFIPMSDLGDSWRLKFPVGDVAIIQDSVLTRNPLSGNALAGILAYAGDDYSYYWPYSGGASIGAIPSSYVVLPKTDLSTARATYEPNGQTILDSASFPATDYLYINGGGIIWYDLNDDRGILELTDDTTATIIRSGSGWYLIHDGEAVSADTFVFQALGGSFKQITRSYTSLIPASGVTMWSFAFNGPAGLRLTHTDDSVEYLAFEDMESVTVSGTTVAVTADGAITSYNTVKDIAIVAPAAYTTIDYRYILSSSITAYADPTYGWVLPSYTGVYYDAWTNGFSNASVRILVDLPVGADLRLREQYNSTTDIIRLVNNSGNVVVSWPAGDSSASANLGSYTKLVIDVDARQGIVTVSGITAWPNMYAEPARMNTVTVPHTFPAETFSQLTLLAVYGTPTFRIDSASVVAGTFPSTKDYTLNMSALFPDKSYVVKFNSIGIYGDTLTVNGVAYTVTNGRILVGDAVVALKGMTISSVLSDGVYDVSIGSTKVGTSTTPASVGFGGEWSLTITTDFLKEETGTRATWAPGSFAFSQEDFAGVVVLAAVAAFIGVGIYGARSGLKIGLLIMICGGAALVAMITL